MQLPWRMNLGSGLTRCPGPSGGSRRRLRQFDALAVNAGPGLSGSSNGAVLASDSPVTPGTILLILGDSEVRGLLRCCLEQQGYEVLEAASASEGISVFSQCRPAAILLDLDCLNPDSFSALERLREGTRAHIIALSERADEAQKLRAFESGANDLVMRPFSVAELLARLRAAQRFSIGSEAEVFRSGPLTVDLSSRMVSVSGQSVKLTATEYALLAFLIRNAGKVLTHAQILREIWGPKQVKRLEYLRVYFKSLREKLELDPLKPRLLLTERYVGYRLAVLALTPDHSESLSDQPPPRAL